MREYIKITIWHPILDHPIATFASPNESWSKMTCGIIECDFLNLSKLLPLLIELHPSSRLSTYKLLFGEGHAIIVKPTWHEEAVVEAYVEANVSLSLETGKEIPYYQTIGQYIDSNGVDELSVHLQVRKIGLLCRHGPFPSGIELTRVITCQEHPICRGFLCDYKISDGDENNCKLPNVWIQNEESGCLVAGTQLISEAITEDHQPSSVKLSEQRVEDPSQESASKTPQTSSTPRPKKSDMNNKATTASGTPMPPHATIQESVQAHDDDDKARAITKAIAKARAEGLVNMEQGGTKNLVTVQSNKPIHPIDTCKSLDEKERDVNQNKPSKTPPIPSDKSSRKTSSISQIKQSTKSHSADSNRNKSSKASITTTSSSKKTSENKSSTNAPSRGKFVTCVESSHSVAQEQNIIRSELINVDLSSTPAEGFPEGWVARKVERKTVRKGLTNYSRVWYSPILGLKFWKKYKAQRFVSILKETGGDEQLAWNLMKVDSNTTDLDGTSVEKRGEKRKTRSSTQQVPAGDDKSGPLQKKAKRASASPKPRNAFRIFADENTNIVKAATGLSESNEVTKKLNEMFVALDPAIKAYYCKQAERSLAKWKQDKNQPKAAVNGSV